ncbi:hypothetical protein MJO52_15395 [Microbulbifer variabilis]|uniref:Uncharacterized protein n=1 Tax=Microbulbifer variabilis TaxID=266805 RepID=A0ABY4V839_9GAMM|nr:hypothetical protein [Microbulbifer variabilis]USD20449.1 hypothetical protein MJO52_15395 [Microbulbifer variabilis]
MRRKQFLTEFLGALGAKEIQWQKETDTSISGVVIYEIDDPEEVQEFIWYVQESEVPPENVRKLVELLNEKNLLSIDKISISRKELRSLYSKKQGRIVSEDEFISILEALVSIEVPMVDEGRETDVYFIHE